MVLDITNSNVIAPLANKRNSQLHNASAREKIGKLATVTSKTCAK